MEKNRVLVTKFLRGVLTTSFPDQNFHRLFASAKLFPDFFVPNQNISPIFLLPTNTFTRFFKMIWGKVTKIASSE